MTYTTYSVNDAPIRLTGEIWTHIVENHEDMAGYYFDVMETVANPGWVFEGDYEELWAVNLASERTAILVIYRESKEQNDGSSSPLSLPERSGIF